jgi:hypothetical protein
VLLDVERLHFLDNAPGKATLQGEAKFYRKLEIWGCYKNDEEFSGAVSALEYAL